MEFLVEFNMTVPDGTPESEIEERERAEATAAAELARAGHLIRLWKLPDTSKAAGLYRAKTEAQLRDLLGALPLNDWMRTTVTAVGPHPNDPEAATSRLLPDPHLTLVYRLDATLGQPVELGATTQGRKRIVPLTGGSFSGPEVNGTLLPGASADWQTVLPDGTALGDIRYTLQTDRGALLYVQSSAIRHGSPDVLARLARGDDVNADEYTFRASTRIETALPDLDWLNKGVFTSVAGRQANGVIYETYLVA